MLSGAVWHVNHLRVAHPAVATRQPHSRGGGDPSRHLSPVGIAGTLRMTCRPNAQYRKALPQLGDPSGRRLSPERSSPPPPKGCFLRT